MTFVRRELLAAGLTVFALFLLGALFFHIPAEGMRCSEATGVFGPVGTWLRCALVWTVGIPGTLMLAGVSLMLALIQFGRIRAPGRESRDWELLFAGLIALVPIAVALALAAPEPGTMTGFWGHFMAFYLRRIFGAAGSWFAWLLALSVLTVVTMRWNPIRVLFGRSGSAAQDGAAAQGTRELTLAEKLAPDPADMPQVDPRDMAEVLGLRSPGTGLLARDSAGATAAAEESEKGRVSASEAAQNAKQGRGRPTADERTEAVQAELELHREVEADVDRPPVCLLTKAESAESGSGTQELDLAGEKLMAALRTFRVDGELVGRTTGPTVTQFEIEPGPGVKVRQIAALADDLALAMRAASIRIVAPIPGRGAVGVEVPNPTPRIVRLREVLESKEYTEARAALPIALGKDLEGRPVIADLARMPHLLIAGATGSGKSVCVNTIITSLVYRHTPRTLRFLMVDPKMVELSVYNALPHMRHKVITDNRDAASVLKWALLEMDLRYRLLEANGCRNIQEFNKRIQQYKDGKGQQLLKPRDPDVAFENRDYSGDILPYIVVVIDEMADLMMTVQGEVETPIAMLAQKARAIGIHLILATQRPSVNVITGLIKANFPCRIAFRVASQVDSRTIIDGAGAESLLGNGDMLFIPPGKSEASRLQGAFLSSEDTEKLTSWYSSERERRLLSATGAEEEPDILEAVRANEAKAAGAESDTEGSNGERDKLFREAAEVVINHKQGSTSLLQRRLRIGYSRAARIIDELEEAGVLAPSEGAARPREVLVGFQDLDRICGSD